MATLADSANVREGLLSVLSAGVTHLYRPEFPAPLGVAVAIIVEVSPDDGAGKYAMSVSVERDGDTEEQNAEPSRRSFIKAEFVLPHAPTKYVTIPMALTDVPLTLSRPGLYYLIVAVHDLSEIRIPFYVLDPSGDPGPSPVVDRPDEAAPDDAI